jgi:hypothetical protein
MNTFPTEGFDAGKRPHRIYNAGRDTVVAEPNETTIHSTLRYLETAVKIRSMTVKFRKYLIMKDERHPISSD